MKIGTLVSRPQTLIVCSIVLELTTRTLEIQKIQCLLKVVSIDEGIIQPHGTLDSRTQIRSMTLIVRIATTC